MTDRDDQLPRSRRPAFLTRDELRLLYGSKLQADRAIERSLAAIRLQTLDRTQPLDKPYDAFSLRESESTA